MTTAAAVSPENGAVEAPPAWEPIKVYPVEVEDGAIKVAANGFRDSFRGQFTCFDQELSRTAPKLAFAARFAALWCFSSHWMI
ncbi:MAG: hypothetical protein U5O39_08085 [Gammaproteobacteria bacterium]|nr:hypothetical protein [Gammaproteobacteria bacterium]